MEAELVPNPEFHGCGETGRAQWHPPPPEDVQVLVGAKEERAPMPSKIFLVLVLCLRLNVSHPHSQVVERRPSAGIDHRTYSCNNQLLFLLSRGNVPAANAILAAATCRRTIIVIVSILAVELILCIAE